MQPFKCLKLELYKKGKNARNCTKMLTAQYLRNKVLAKVEFVLPPPLSLEVLGWPGVDTPPPPELRGSRIGC